MSQPASSSPPYFPAPVAVPSSLVPVLPRTEPDELPGYTPIGPVASDRQVRDWALVLQSMEVWHERRRTQHGWVLFVRDEDYARASGSIHSYEVENRDWPPRAVRERVRHGMSPVVPAIFAAMVAFFFVTGPAAAHSRWFERGVAISAQVVSSEPWRAVTALTLHADSVHVLGNAISGTVFGAAVARRLGPGGAALGILASGVLGNVANAVYHQLAGVGHASIGASTAVFGAIGLLAATQVALDRPASPRPRTWLEIAAPIVGGFALLGALGAGGAHTDLGAHLFGFLGGVLLGLGVAFPLRRARLAVDVAGGHAGHEVELGAGAPAWWVQAGLGTMAAAVLVVAWGLALRH